jgi:alkylhydroperoxidase family enzyme
MATWNPEEQFAMDPMNLREIEEATRELPLLQAVKAERGMVPQIFHLIAYKPEANRHLAQFTEAVMRGPSPLSPGFRELIAAFTSGLNHCPF